MMMKIKNKRYKKVCHEKNLKFEDYKNSLEAAQTENQINNLEKNKIDIDSLKEVHKELITKINIKNTKI